MTNRAVVASANGQGCVLSFSGTALSAFIGENGTRDLRDLGLDDAPDGIWVWEGKIVTTKMWTDYGWEHDCGPEGEFRKPTDPEWEAIRRGECPW